MIKVPRVIGRALYLGVCVFIVLTGTAVAQDTVHVPTAAPAEVGLSPERLQVLSDYFETGVAEGRFPGAVVLVSRGGKVAFHEAFGLRDPATEAPMKTDAIFRLYSMTKPLLAAATLVQAERGKLGLGTPLGDVLPDFKSMQVLDTPGDGSNPSLRPAEREIRILDLLRMSGGFAGYNFYPDQLGDEFRAAGIGGQDLTLAEAAKRTAKIPLLYEPGTTFTYSETSFNVLGRALEVVAKKPIAEVFEKTFTRPNGMQDTGFELTKEQAERLAQPNLKGEHPSKPLFDPTQPRAFHSPANGMLASSLDYWRFLQMLLDGGRSLEGNQIISATSVETMLTGQTRGLARGVFDPIRRNMPGFRFGLGIGVRVQGDSAYVVGGSRLATWGGYGGTFCVIDRDRDLVGIIMLQQTGLFSKVSIFQTLLLQTAVD